MVTVIYLAAISASVLPAMVVCALASVVAAGAFNAPVSYWRIAFVGAAIGLVFGIADFYLVRLLVYTLASSLPDQSDRLFRVVVGVVFAALAAALSATAASSIAAKPGSAPRPVPVPAIVGGGFGVVAGIANAAIGMAVPGVAVEPTTDTAVVLALVSFTIALSVVAIVVADVILAAVAFRFVRRRWGARAIVL